VVAPRPALALTRLGLPVVGIAATIDNDLIGTDASIGCDTALNVAAEAIDRCGSPPPRTSAPFWSR